MKIQQKLVLLLLAFCVLPLLIVGLFEYHTQMASIERQLGLSFQDRASHLIEQIDWELYEHYRDLQAWATLGVMQEVMTDDVDNRISSFFLDHRKREQNLVTLYAVNRKGVVVASGHPELIGRPGDMPECVHALSGQPSIGEARQEPGSAMWMVAMAVPVLGQFAEEPSPIGAICAAWRMVEFLPPEEGAAMPSVRSGSYWLLMRRDGILLAQDGAAGFANTSNLTNLITAGLRSAALTNQAKTGYFIDRYGDTRVLVGYDRSSGHRDFPGLGWAVLVIQEAKSVFAVAAVHRNRLFGLGLILGILVVLLTLSVTKRISAPIQQLTELAHVVAEGDLSQTIQIRSRDEVGELAHAFNRMTNHLKASRSELVAANQHLAHLVALKDELIATVSHELRTPLTSIKEGVNLILDNALGGTTAEQQDFLTTMSQDVDRLGILIENLLDVSKLESGRMERFRRRIAIPQMIESVLRSYQPLMGVRKIVVDCAQAPSLFVDPNQITSVFSNLFSNALKFTRNDGTIAVRAHQEGEEVVVAVEDDGCGIAPEDLPKLFQKFSQVGARDPNQPRGTGLGLLVCKEFVELNQGRIEVASTLGRGSTFLVRLPRYSDDAALSESFREVQRLAAPTHMQRVGIVLIQAEAFVEALEEGDARLEALERLAETVRQNLHRADIVLTKEPARIIILAVTDEQGLPAILKRLRESVRADARLRFAATLQASDEADVLALLARAEQLLDRGGSP